MDFQGMIFKALATPSTGKMLTNKLKDMYGFLAKQYECEVKDIALMIKVDSVKAGDNGDAQYQDKAVIYVYVQNKPIQKIPIEQFLGGMTSGEAKKEFEELNK